MVDLTEAPRHGDPCRARDGLQPDVELDADDDEDAALAKAVALSIADAAGAPAAPCAWDVWSCPMCTLDNPAVADQCEACGERRRPTAAPRADAVPDVGGPEVAAVPAELRHVGPGDDLSLPVSTLVDAGSRCSARTAADGTAISHSGSSRNGTIVLLVDERERVANARPLGIYLDLRDQLADMSSGLQQLRAERQSLSLGDFVCMREASAGGSRLLNAVVERKRIGDLVTRSAKGAHVDQLRRMQLGPLRSCPVLRQSRQCIGG